MGGCRVRRSGHDFTIEGGFQIGVLSHLHWEILCVLVPKAVPERERRAVPLGMLTVTLTENGRTLAFLIADFHTLWICEAW